MAREVMERRASDNVYLHKDFHGALSTDIEYLHAHFGEDAVRDYLRQFTVIYYAPLIAELRGEGLPALKRHFEELYAVEGGEVDIMLSDDELVLTVHACPAVKHMREHGYMVARLFRETIKTVNEALCTGTSFAAELVEYDDATGRSIQRFYRRRP